MATISRRCPVCREEKNDVRFRRTFSLKKGNPQHLKLIKMCGDCWKAHSAPAGEKPLPREAPGAKDSR